MFGKIIPEFSPNDLLRPEEQMATQNMPQNTPQLNPMVKQYLQSKSGGPVVPPMPQNNTMPQANTMSQNEIMPEEPQLQDTSINPLAQLAAGMGASLAGRNPNEAFEFFDRQKQSGERANQLALDRATGKLKLAEDLKQRDIDNKFREKQLKETIDSRREIAAMNRMGQQQAQSERKVAGQQKQQQAMNEVNDRYTNIKDSINNLRGIVNQYGTQELFGPENKIMDQQITAIATDMAKLVDPASVARESEVAAFKKMLFEPGFWQRESSVQGVLSSFEDLVDKRLENAYKIRGLERPQTIPKSGSFPRQVRKGNQVATVSNEQELQEAMSEGFN